jgi:hypothetical protein
MVSPLTWAIIIWGGLRAHDNVDTPDNIDQNPEQQILKNHHHGNLITYK